MLDNLENMKNMKNMKNENIGLFNCKSFAIAALIFLLWLGNTSSSFGYVTIESSANADCSGSVSVSGSVYCENCEGSPGVGIVPATGGEPILPTVYEGCFVPGSYETTTVYLKPGVNVITASDSCDGEDSVSVVSNGGGGPSLAWSATKVCSSSHAGWSSTLTMCCLTPGNYTLEEDVTWANSGCPAIFNDSNGTPVPFTVVAGQTCGSHTDDNSGPGYGVGWTCSVLATQGLTVRDASNNTIGTFTDYGAFVWQIGSMSLTMSGDGVGNGGAMTCP